MTGAGFCVVIPARMGSTRLPGKALADIGGRPMVVRVAERAAASGAARVVVATDGKEIAAAAEAAGFEACVTGECDSGTARVAQAAETLGLSGVVVNLQGDEPGTDPGLVAEVAREAASGGCEAATAAAGITDEESEDPDTVKVVADEKGRALYFSRAPIPARRGAGPPRLGHIGIYAFAPGRVAEAGSLPATELERSEGLEQLRWLWHGWRISVVRAKGFSHGVDTERDLEKARRAHAREGA